MKKVICLLMTVMFCSIVASCKPKEKVIVPLPEIEEEKEEIKTTASKESIRILAIGNSFSDNAMKYLYPILKALGAKEIILGNMYIGGCSIETHYNNALNDSAKYIYRKNDSRSQNAGIFENTSNTPLSTAIVDEDWQYVTLQQASHFSGLINEYNDEQINYLNNYVRENTTNKDLKVGWHMTWAYQQDSTHSAFPNYNRDQMTMYDALVGCTEQKIVTNDKFDFVIPSGTAVQNARTSYVSDTLTIDGYHLNSLGEFIIGLTWALKITNWSIDDLDIDLVPSEFKRDINMIKESAVNALKTPFEVTKSVNTTKPVEPEIDLSNYTLLDWQPALGFWNSQSSVDLIVTDAIANQFVSSAIRFTKEDLPVGSIIFIDENYKYRPEGWISLTDTSDAARPGIISTSMVVIDEAWWGNYQLRAFNVFLSPREDMTNRVLETKDVFRIYVPKA